MYNRKFLLSLTCFVGMLWVAQGTWLSGEGYRNLKFSGSNWVQIPSSVSQNAGKEFSFEAWVMCPQGNTIDALHSGLNRPIASRYNSSIAAPNNNLNDFDLQINPQGYVVFFVGGSFDLGFIMFSNNPIEADRWYHIAFSIEYDDIASSFPYRAELYVDNWSAGVVARDNAEALWFGPGYPRIVLTNEFISLGKYQNDDSVYPNGQYFIGNIDEVRIWKGRRLGSDFLNFANRTVSDKVKDTWTLTASEGGSSSNELIAAYNFNGVSSMTIYDKSKFASHAAIIGDSTEYGASEIQIISYAYATGEIPVRIKLYGINKEDISLTGFNFQIQYLANEVKGELYNYDATNSGVPNQANPKRPAGIQIPGIGSQVLNNGYVSGDSVVFVYVPQIGLSGRFFYVVTDGITVSKRTEVRIQIACVQPVDVIDVCGVCNGHNSSLDACGKCFGDNTTCWGCDRVPNSGKNYDACGLCGGNNSTCWGCDYVPNSHATYDNCGVCGGNDASCTGCDGVLHSSLKYDACGVCGGHNETMDVCGVCNGNGMSCVGCDNVPGSNKHYDVCGVCDGNGQSCWDCAHVSNGPARYDACGVCDGDNTTCWGCDHVPNSHAQYDNCGVCGGDDACRGCDGVLWSGLVRDWCGVCGGNNGTCVGCDESGGGEYDACGVCRGDNSTCGGCDFLGGQYDECGVCNGDNSTCTCVLYHGYHVQELDYILLQWGLNHTIENLNNVLVALDGALDRLEDYNGDLDLAAVVLYINDFLGTSFKDFEDVVDAFTHELDISLGNIYIGPVINA